MLDEQMKKLIEKVAYRAWNGIASDFISAEPYGVMYPEDAISPTFEAMTDICWPGQCQDNEGDRQIIEMIQDFDHPARNELYVIVLRVIEGSFPY